MKIGVICGSHREQSQSEKIGRYAATQLKDRVWRRGICLLPGRQPAAVLGRGPVAGRGTLGRGDRHLRAELDSCDGFVVVTPEWHGMVPAGLKNFFLLWPGSGVLAHKPALIISRLRRCRRRRLPGRGTAHEQLQEQRASATCRST
jgi:NAD(P)H-dependent FMN reductase